MKTQKYTTLIIVLFLCYACSNSEPAENASSQYVDVVPRTPDDYLFRIQEGQNYIPGTPCGYVDIHGDTLIPPGKYGLCWTDTLKNFAVVWEEKTSAKELIAINRNDERLFEVQLYDNGPDYLNEGLFRVLRNGKTGFANEQGELIIPTVYECAFPFSDGKAKVAFNCKKQKDTEGHTIMESEEWFFIDPQGKKLKD